MLTKERRGLVGGRAFGEGEAVGVVGVYPNLLVVQEDVVVAVGQLGVVEQVFTGLDDSGGDARFLAPVHKLESILRFRPASYDSVEGFFVLLAGVGG